MLLAASVAFAGEDRASAMAVVGAMREYYALLGQPGNGNIESIRDRLIANVPHGSYKTQKSVRTQIEQGFKAKYKKDAAFHKCLAQILAAQGKRGLNRLYKVYRSMRKQTETRAAIAQAMAGCKDESALDLLLKMVHDDEEKVAAVAVAGTARYVPKDGDAKRRVMRTLVDLYAKVTAKAQGEPKLSDERRRYDVLKPVLDKTLDAYSGGEKLDSAQAWDAWLREQAADGS